MDGSLLKFEMEKNDWDLEICRKNWKIPPLIKPHFYTADFSKKKIPKASIQNQFEDCLPSSNQQHRQFETDLDLFNPSNTRYVYGVD